MASLTTGTLVAVGAIAVAVVVVAATPIVSRPEWVGDVAGRTANGVREILARARRRSQ